MFRSPFRRGFAPALMIPTLILGGCASTDRAGYPSLAPRPVEGHWAAVAPAEAPAPPGPLPVEVNARIDALLGRVEAADRAFASARAAADAAVARGGAVGSETWVVGHQEISRLDAVRGAAPGALAELDALVLARTNDSQWDGMPALTAARERAAAMVAAQDAVIAALTARMR